MESIEVTTCMVGSFKHHLPDVLPQRAADVVPGPHVAVGGFLNSVRDGEGPYHAVRSVTLISYAEGPSGSTGLCPHDASSAVPSNGSVAPTAGVTGVTPSALGSFTPALTV